MRSILLFLLFMLAHEAVAGFSAPSRGGGFSAPARSYSAPSRAYSAPSRSSSPSYTAPARSPSPTYTAPARNQPPVTPLSSPTPQSSSTYASASAVQNNIVYSQPSRSFGLLDYVLFWNLMRPSNYNDPPGYSCHGGGCSQRQCDPMQK